MKRLAARDIVLKALGCCDVQSRCVGHRRGAKSQHRAVCDRKWECVSPMYENAGSRSSRKYLHGRLPRYDRSGVFQAVARDLGQSAVLLHIGAISCPYYLLMTGIGAQVRSVHRPKVAVRLVEEGFTDVSIYRGDWMDWIFKNGKHEECKS